jgi:hypothetical protein
VTLLQFCGYAAQLLAAASALILAKRNAAHRSAAGALSLLAIAASLDGPIAEALRPLPHPIEGPARALVYLDGALSLGTSALTVAGLCVVLAVAPERRRFVVVLFIGFGLSPPQCWRRSTRVPSSEGRICNAGISPPI